MCETQMTWSISESVYLRSLLVMMLLTSANPKSEWSVKQALMPIVRACKMASWHRLEKACGEKKEKKKRIMEEMQQKKKRSEDDKKKKKKKRK